jgi:hypothetical protein
VSISIFLSGCCLRLEVLDPKLMGGRSIDEHPDTHLELGIDVYQLAGFQAAPAGVLVPSARGRRSPHDTWPARWNAP